MKEKNLAQVVSVFDKPKKRTLQEVYDIIQVAKPITQKYYAKSSDFITEMDICNDSKNHKKLEQLEEEMNGWVQKWKICMKAIGARPVGFWTLDFESDEDGFFSWTYPKESVSWHSYSGGFKTDISFKQYFENSKKKLKSENK